VQRQPHIQHKAGLTSAFAKRWFMFLLIRGCWRGGDLSWVSIDVAARSTGIWRSGDWISGSEMGRSGRARSRRAFRLTAFSLLYTQTHSHRTG